MKKPLKLDRGPYQTGAMIRQHPLRRWRWKQGLSMDQMAAQLDIRQETISKIETWGYYPSLHVVARIRRLTGLSANVFLPPDEAPHGR